VKNKILEMDLSIDILVNIFEKWSNSPSGLRSSQLTVSISYKYIFLSAYYKLTHASKKRKEKEKKTNIRN
jgi:hypothetical protein